MFLFTKHLHVWKQHQKRSRLRLVCGTGGSTSATDFDRIRRNAPRACSDSRGNPSHDRAWLRMVLATVTWGRRARLAWPITTRSSPATTLADRWAPMASALSPCNRRGWDCSNAPVPGCFPARIRCILQGVTGWPRHGLPKPRTHTSAYRAQREHHVTPSAVHKRCPLNALFGTGSLASRVTKG